MYFYILSKLLIYVTLFGKLIAMIMKLVSRTMTCAEVLANLKNMTEPLLYYLVRSVNDCGLSIPSLYLCITINVVKVCRRCPLLWPYRIIIRSMVVVYVAVIVFS